MLDDCGALLFASDAKWIAKTTALCETLGFGETAPFDGIEDLGRRARRRAITYILADYRIDADLLAHTVRIIRHHDADPVRFAPMLAFTKGLDAEIYGKYIRMGFDDIIAFPQTMARVARRLRAQLDTPIDYFQAGPYFGPDRRRLLEEEPEDDREPGEGFTRLVITRDARKGIEIVETHDHQAAERRAG
ncbi:hypothetical protein [Pelagibacterium montanilacus]|uniref:hypothetical protein n=1 Tax=Pelagibacterium montanilacus TaxID=2185280 RepID=UPI000F8EE342|nr:hypothetical protein [Pelagibacterium montanilacus]